MRLTADQWQLFTCSMKCGKVAVELNKQLNVKLKEAKKLIKKGHSVDSVASIVRDAMYPVMSRYSKYGATDTEPLWVLVDVINKELGSDISRW